MEALLSTYDIAAMVSPAYVQDVRAACMCPEVVGDGHVEGGDDSDFDYHVSNIKDGVMIQGIPKGTKDAALFRFGHMDERGALGIHPYTNQFFDDDRLERL